MINDPRSMRDVWELVGQGVKKVTGIVDGRVGMMLIEKDGAIAMIIVGDENVHNDEERTRIFKKFQDRVGDVVTHSSAGVIDFKKHSQVFVRNERTGKFEESKPDEN